MIGWLEHPDDFSQPNLFAEQLWTQWNYELQRCVRDSKWAVVCRQSPTGPFKVLPPDSWSHFELTDYRAGLMRAASGECAFSTHFVPLSWPEELDVIAEELGIFGSSDGARANEEQVGPEEEPHEGTANPAVAGVSDPVAGKQRHTSREEKEYTRRLTAYMAENEPVLSKKKIRELTGGNRLPNAAFERSWDAADKASCKGFSSPGRRPSSGNFDTSPQADLPANEE
ncbi:hypothetical protein SLNSH_23585 [Alsobacter soli]|uniref:Uncharacterized protein n=2 Tax=Alsobacter soli TaxID=2109933 RepID=A0A2T1HLK3_9HYPH|nr:hypothetical protein SLNSH_23585 [Alsobacter soli]